MVSIQTEEESETEVSDTDSYLTTLEECNAYLAAFTEHASQQSTPPLPREITEKPSCEPTKLVAATPREVEVTKKPLHQPTDETAGITHANSAPLHINANETHNYIRLPKLVPSVEIPQVAELLGKFFSSSSQQPKPHRRTEAQPSTHPVTIGGRGCDWWFPIDGQQLCPLC